MMKDLNAHNIVIQFLKDCLPAMHKLDDNHNKVWIELLIIECFKFLKNFCKNDNK